MKNVTVRKKRSGLRQRDVKNWIFIAIMSAIPLIQFAVFYIYVNFNTIILSFQEYTIVDPVNNIGAYKWNNFGNFTKVWKELTEGGRVLLFGLKNSAILYAVSTLLATPLTLFFSYYIYKKKPFHKTFKVMLFLPSIISSLVMTLLFKYFVSNSVPYVVEKLFGTKMTSPLAPEAPYSTTFGTVLFYSVWCSFGTSMLMYSGAMNNISESMVEACHLDGANNIQEFWYVTLPGVFPTLTTFLTASIAGFFTADMGLYAFFQDGASDRIATIGYYIFKETRDAGLTGYPYLACLGLILTIIAMPFTFGLRKLLFRFGPSTER